MQRMKLVALLLAAFVAGCAQLPSQNESVAPAQVPAETRSQYLEGLAHYGEKRFDAALHDLSAALAGGNLTPADANNARKHIAFIHCVAGRELSCREQFRAILESDPEYDIPSSEPGHPRSDAVWRSVKGAMEEQRALTQASSADATPAQHKLVEGIREYDAARYRDALDNLLAAVKEGLPTRADEMRAHKYTAFAYCLTRRIKQCRAEFRLIFAKDPAFELLPSESGHPAWAAVYRSEKATAAKGKKK